MKNIEKITERILADAKAEAERIVAEADARCAEITARSDKAAQEEYWKLFRKGTAEAALHLERLTGAAQLEAKKRLLREKQEILSETFDKAVDRLLALPEELYIAFLARLAADASVTGGEEIILSAGDRERVGTAVCSKANSLLESRNRPAGLVLSESTRDMRGGLVLSSGSIEMNCSLEALVGARKSALSGEVAKLLFD